MSSQPLTSDAAILKATGHTWKQWFGILDRLGAEKLDHQRIVQLLHKHKLLPSGWWRQMVTNGYEKHLGKRELGETLSGGFEIGVQKTMHLPAKRLWQLITSPAIVKIWLGTNATVKEEHEYQTTNGTHGQFRVVKANSHLRVTWQPKDWAKPSLIQVRVEDNGDSTVLGFHHEKLPNADTRANMKQHWQKIMTDVTTAIEESA